MFSVGGEYAIDWTDKIKRLVGRKVLCRKCVNDHVRNKSGDVVLYMPDSVLDPVSGMDWFQIEAVSPDCEDFTVDNVGCFIHCPPYAHGMHRLTDDFFVFDERLIGDGGSNCVIKPFVLEQ